MTALLLALGMIAFALAEDVTSAPVEIQVGEEEALLIGDDAAEEGYADFVGEEPVPEDAEVSSTNYIVPPGRTEIHQYEFYGKSNLIAGTIPEGVTVIRDLAFCNCYNLAAVDLPSTLRTIEMAAFENTSLVYIKIPDSVNEIGNGAFKKCSLLVDIALPKGLTRISYNMLQDCTSLVNTTIPETVSEIGIGAFANCSSLKKVRIPDSVTSLGSEVFKDCRSLESVALGKGLTRIHDKTFANCTALKTIYIPPNIKWFIDNPFLNCSNLTIICEDGSKALEYAKENGIPYRVMPVEMQMSIGDLYKEVGDQYQLHVEFTPSYASSEVKWSSSDNTIAMVDDEGRILATGKGVAEITAVAENGVKATCKVHVVELPTAVTLDAGSASLDVGKTLQLKGSLVPEEAVSPLLWTCADGKIATVDQNGLVKAVGVGSTTITVTTTNGCAARMELTVTESAKLSATKLTLNAGNSGKQLQVDQLQDRGVKWKSSNAKVASVTDKGLVKPLAAGSCEISASIENGETLICKVTVKDKAAISKKTAKLVATDKLSLKITGLGNRKVTWSSSNKKIATVKAGRNGTATVKALKTGKATIIAKIKNGKSLKCVVKVSEPLTLKPVRVEKDNEYNDAVIKCINNSGKDITYFDLVIDQYDKKGRKLESQFSTYFCDTRIKAKSNDTVYWFVDSRTSKVKVRVVSVKFSDKSTYKP